MANEAKLVERACVVCGQGSHRTDWIKSVVVNGQTLVACDHHTDKEFSEAVACATQPPPAKPVEKPVEAQQGTSTPPPTTPPQAPAKS